jgi:hypothetical protein
MKITKTLIEQLVRKQLNGYLKESLGGDDAQELMLYAENDGDLYRQRYQPIVKNLLAKKKRGVYDFAKSIQLWMYFVNAAAQKYNKEFGTPDVPWNKVFDKQTRLEVAKHFAEQFEQEEGQGLEEKCGDLEECGGQPAYGSPDEQRMFEESLNELHDKPQGEPYKQPLADREADTDSVRRSGVVSPYTRRDNKDNFDNHPDNIRETQKTKK